MSGFVMRQRRPPKTRKPDPILPSVPHEVVSRLRARIMALRNALWIARDTASSEEKWGMEGRSAVIRGTQRALDQDDEEAKRVG